MLLKNRTTLDSFCVTLLISLCAVCPSYAQEDIQPDLGKPEERATPKETQDLMKQSNMTVKELIREGIIPDEGNNSGGDSDSESGRYKPPSSVDPRDVSAAQGGSGGRPQTQYGTPNTFPQYDGASPYSTAGYQGPSRFQNPQSNYLPSQLQGQQQQPSFPSRFQGQQQSPYAPRMQGQQSAYPPPGQGQPPASRMPGQQQQQNAGRPQSTDQGQDSPQQARNTQAPEQQESAPPPARRKPPSEDDSNF